MANEWIKMRHSLLTSPKMAMLAVSLGINRHEAIGLFFQAMVLADTEANPNNGEILCSPQAFDAICGHAGVAQALADVGWLVLSSCGETVAFVNYDEHNSASTKARDAHAKRTRDARKAHTNGAHSYSSSSSSSLSLSLEETERKRKTFADWWASYPRRGNSPKGSRKEAEAEWDRLTPEQEADVVAATQRLVKSGQIPKDAQRFLRPVRGKGDPVYTEWLGDAMDGPAVEFGGKADRAGVQHNHGEESGADRSWAKEQA